MKEYEEYMKPSVGMIWANRKRAISDACGYDEDEYRRWVEPINFALDIGSRIFLAAADDVIEDEHVSEAIKLATSLEIHEETSKLYAVELIPKEDSEFICHMLRQLYSIEHDLMLHIRYENTDGYLLEESGGKSCVSAQVILDIICSEYGITENAVRFGKSTEVILPRRIAMYFCKRLTSMTDEEIVEFFGKQSIDAITYGITCLKFWTKRDKDLQKTLEKIEEVINAKAMEGDE